MTFLTQLDVINDMLASLGESPLNSLDEEHPYVAAGLRMIRVTSYREQAKSWWFNKELVTITPDAVTGFIYTPADAIRVDPTNTTLNYVQRGRRLYQPYAAASVDKYSFTSPVTCYLVRLLPFEDLPPSAQAVISCASQVDFQKAYEADQLKYQQIVADLREARVTLNSEHIRNVNVNLLRRPTTAQTLNRLGQ